MDSLSELIHLVTRKRIKKIELFDEHSRNKSSNYYKLFHGIHSKKYQSDDDAAHDIYQCDASAKKYLILKTRLKQKLLNTLFFLDISPSFSITEYELTKHECDKILFYAEVLMTNDNTGIAVPILEKTMRKAQSLGLTTVEYVCAGHLRAYHCKEKNYKEFLSYKAIADESEERMMAENYSEKSIQYLQARYFKLRSDRENIIEEAEEILQKVGTDVQKYESDKLKHNFHCISTLYNRINQDFKGVLQTQLNQLAHHKKSPHYFSQESREELINQVLNSFLHRRDLEGAEKFLEAEGGKIQADSPKWFAQMEYRFMLGLHSGDFQKAASIFAEALGHSGFRLLPEQEKEKWKTFMAYLHFFYKSHKLKEIRAMIQNSKISFKLSEYVDDRPAFDKDLRGMQIGRLASQVLFYLERWDLTGVSDTIQALNLYCRRYPKRDNNYRSECFIHMLKDMEEEEFRFFQTRKRTEKMYNELQNTPMDYIGEVKQLEVYPYEKIWELILERLKAYRYG